MLTTSLLLAAVAASTALLLPQAGALRVAAPRGPLAPRAGAPALCAAVADVSADELRDEVLRDILLQEVPDQAVNELTWRCLGYRPDPAVAGGWSSEGVFPGWRKNYPTPPDLVGVTRTYSREVDEPVLRAVQALQRSVPREHKEQLKPTLRPLGWKGFQMEGLTPNMTRRAQVSTWLLYYRKALLGVSLEELVARKQARAAAEAEAEATGVVDPAISSATGTTKQSVI